MNRFASISCSFRLGLLAAFFTALPGRGLAGDKTGQVAEIAAPKAATVATNAAAAGGQALREDLLKERLRDRILQPFRSAADSLDGAFAEPVVPQESGPSPGEIRRAKERLQRDRAWIFADPDSAGQSGDDSMNANPEDAGLERDTREIMKRQNQNPNQLSVTNKSGRNGSDDQNGASQSDDAYNRRNDKQNSRSATQSKNQSGGDSVKGFFDSNSPRGFGATAPGNIFSDTFNRTETFNPPTERSPMERQRDSDFQKLLNADSPASSPGGLGLNPLGSPGNSPPGGLSALGGGTVESRSLPTMATMPGYNPGAASSLSPVLSSPAVAPVQSLAPERPPMSDFYQPSGPPRRQF